MEQAILLLTGEALVFPNIRFHGIAAAFPIAGFIYGGELQTLQPFDAFPQINVLQVFPSGDGSGQTAQRGAMCSGDRFTFIVCGQEEILRRGNRQGQIGHESRPMLDEEFCGRQEFDQASSIRVCRVMPDQWVS